MIIVLDKETNMRLMEMPDNNNLYLVSMLGEAKTAIQTTEQNNDVLLKVTMQQNCTALELMKILNQFSEYLFTKKPEISGVLLRWDEDELLTSIGFAPLCDQSEFLYKENSSKTKEGRGQK